MFITFLSVCSRYLLYTVRQNLLHILISEANLVNCTQKTFEKILLLKLSWSSAVLFLFTRIADPDPGGVDPHPDPRVKKKNVFRIRPSKNTRIQNFSYNHQIEESQKNSLIWTFTFCWYFIQSITTTGNCWRSVWY